MALKSLSWAKPVCKEHRKICWLQCVCEGVEQALPEEDGSECCGFQAPWTLRTILVQEGKVLGENHPLCLQSLGLGQWLWAAEELGS